MDLKTYKVVRVAFPIAVPGLYDYEIPERLTGLVQPGAAVLVELRNRNLWGVAVSLVHHSAIARLKPIIEIKTDRWSDSDRSLITLYEWIAAYYQTDLGKVFKPFIRKGMAEAKAKTVAVYQCLNVNYEPTLTDKQALALGAMRLANEALSAPALKSRFGISAHMLAALCSKGMVISSTQTQVRQAEEMKVVAEGGEVVLTQEQRDAVEVMALEMYNPRRPCLLYGITGSGKTYVYIELVKKALAAGKGVIILVPEISLTPQTISRFKHAVGSVITVIHSRMSDGERRDSLEELVTGRKRVVIGVRSAIVAPMENVGLIIVDEEHDGSYKQSDMDPRYNARDVAVMRARLQKALVVLGSATPSFESYHNALVDKYRLVILAARFGAATLPRVEIVDMGVEHRENNWTLLSRLLHRRITETLFAGRQVILLLNRRGFSTFLLCKDCGHTYACPRCSVKLTYHKYEHHLKCHQCGYGESAPSSCPKCRGEQIKFKGIGIQKAEEFIRTEFPLARLLRMDQDTTRRKGAHMELLEKFSQREADILLGTQMVAKGLNFPGVALVGVIQADIGLHFPDFRATEKTFQLLAQVAGRAGREDSSGEVIIQTYFPDDPGIVSARDHDFVGFYAKEIAAREGLGYPPFGKLARILVQGEAEAAVKSTISAIALAATSRPQAELTVLGPVPAVFERINNLYRYSLILKSKTAKSIQSCVGFIRATVARPPKGVSVIIDIDPVNML